jgi:hypothetical protein
MRSQRRIKWVGHLCAIQRSQPQLVAVQIAVIDKIAQGSRVSKSSKIGEISFGFVSQNSAVAALRNSFGAVTNLAHINSSNFQFGQAKLWSWLGSVGYFIYPTLRAEQPHIISQWENALLRF